QPYLTGPADFPNGTIIVSKYTGKGRKFSRSGDILITVKGSGTGKVIESDDNYAISRQLMAIRATDFDPKFTYYNVVSSLSRYEGAASGLIPGISREDVLGTPLLIPPLPEQKKIAQILSTWDQAITATERLLENSQQRKKGLMQQFLTGKKRLPGFEGEFNTLTLSDAATITMGTSPKSAAYNSTGDGLPLLQGNADIENRRSQPRVFTSEVTKVCQPGSILLSVRAPVGSVAISNHEACIGRGICAIEAKHDNDQEFLYQWMLWYEPRWTNLSQGSTFESVNSADIKNLRIKLPGNDEQKAISKVLSVADRESELLMIRLSNLKQEKKALMQQLLTGKRRVNVETEAA
ncbi:restriction endonuclease subunit S, partial [Salinivibrio sp. VYel6]|uniref:restriction endonuclease subunit S n=1 Tax=Salinivibrio sp. VYel6 TaxID=2490493 RepID=UPI00128BD93E